MFINTRTQVIPSVTQSRDLPQNTPAASQDPSAEQHDDGLVHGHSWAYAQGEKEGPVGLRQGATVADASSIRTPSSAVHDDLHYS